MDSLPKLPDNKPLHGRDYNRLAEHINRTTRIRVGEGLQLKRSAAGQMLYVDTDFLLERREIWAIISGAIPITHRDKYNHLRRRWIYEWEQVHREAVGGVGCWTKPEGWIGSSEEGGDYPGAQNSADWAWIGDPTQPDDIYISPVPVGTVVRLSIIETADNWKECWFHSPTNQDTRAPQEGVVGVHQFYNPNDFWNIYHGEGNVSKGKCLKIKMVGAVNYDPDTFICTAYVRWLTFDPSGRLVAISKEEEENVFTAVECPEG